MKTSIVRSTLRAGAGLVAALALGGCVYGPDYGYVRGDGYGGDAYYGADYGGSPGYYGGGYYGYGYGYGPAVGLGIYYNDYGYRRYGQHGYGSHGGYGNGPDRGDINRNYSPIPRGRASNGGGPRGAPAARGAVRSGGVRGH